MSSDHTIRTEVRLSGSIPATFIMGKDLDGIYIGGDFQGLADGWYDANLPGLVPDGYWQSGTNTGAPGDGVWSGGANQGLADGWYQLNVRVTLQDGIWIGEAYHGVANGWYSNNSPGSVPDGYWTGGALGPVPDGYWSGGSIGTVPNGVWQGGTNTGLADGWYVANLPALVPNGLWVGGVNTGPVGDGLWVDGANTGPLSDGIYVGQSFQEVATGYYVDNSPAPVPDGYWSGGVLGPVPDGVWQDGDNAGLAQGYYVNNSPAQIPDGCYRNGGLVDPYYERIRDAALAEGGGLYLFQLEHGQYAGEQVIWQDAAGTTPWEPGLGTPQGKTLDLCGSGEFLSQAVSMRRPVDGVFDGVSTFLLGSSRAVGGHLHWDAPSAWFSRFTPSESTDNSRTIFSTTEGISTGPNSNGVAFRPLNGGMNLYYVGGGATRGTILLPHGSGVDFGVESTVGASFGSDRKRRTYLDGEMMNESASQPVWGDDTVSHYLPTVGMYRPSSGGGWTGKIDYIAIYTREPTLYEISLHKRAP